eukprot:scaffold1403_cov14-Prasinocladus_malaysianus.AAC.1
MNKSGTMSHTQSRGIQETLQSQIIGWAFRPQNDGDENVHECIVSVGEESLNADDKQINDPSEISPAIDNYEVTG